VDEDGDDGVSDPLPEDGLAGDTEGAVGDPDELIETLPGGLTGIDIGELVPDPPVLLPTAEA